MVCCSKSICNGCCYANTKREIEQGLEVGRCVYCREPAPKSQEERDKRIMERIKKHDDPVSMTHMGKKHYQKGEYDKALQHYTKAAELGDTNAHCCLGTLYYDGNGVEKNDEKAVYHLERAAIGGHALARGLLGDHEHSKGRSERAAKHFIIVTNLGDDISLQCIKELFVKGIVSKEEYAAALRGYQTAVDATKNAEREKAEAVHNEKCRERDIGLP